MILKYVSRRSHLHTINEAQRTPLLQVKVRRSLAFSMHEIIKLLNETDMKNDIVSIFDDFCCDVDEVKIGALSHLSQFLKVSE